MRAGAQRLDKWLWFARFAKTRSMAAKLVAEGHVRLNGHRVETPAKPVGPGDVGGTDPDEVLEQTGGGIVDQHADDFVGLAGRGQQDGEGVRTGVRRGHD